jgi:subtilisin family serine protease
MHRSLRRVIVAGMVAAGLLAACSQDPTAPDQQSLTQAPLLAKVPGGEYVQDGYIVVFKADVADVESNVSAIAENHGFKADHQFKSAIKGFSGKLTADQLTALQNDPRVKYIEQDAVVHMSTTQTGATWGLDRIDQTALPLSGTYTYNYTGAGVKACTIDTGIRFTHNDFGGRAIAGVDEISSSNGGVDQNGHGTHVSGTVGGTTYGVAKGVTLVAASRIDRTSFNPYNMLDLVSSSCGSSMEGPR